MKCWIDGSLDRICFIFEKGTSPKVYIFDIDEATGNRGEYSALTSALIFASLLHIEELEVLSDSQLLVYQVNSKLDPSYKPRYSIKDTTLKEKASVVIRLVKEFKKFSLSWIPREENLAGKELEKKK